MAASNRYLCYSGALIGACCLVVGCATNKPTPAPAAAAAAGSPFAATTQAISDAQAVVGGAQGPCAYTGNAGDLIQQAEAAASAGDDAKAQQLAALGKQIAYDMINNCWARLAGQLYAHLTRTGAPIVQPPAVVSRRAPVPLNQPQAPSCIESDALPFELIYPTRLEIGGEHNALNYSSAMLVIDPDHNNDENRSGATAGTQSSQGTITRYTRRFAPGLNFAPPVISASKPAEEDAYFGPAASRREQVFQLTLVPKATTSTTPVLTLYNLHELDCDQNDDLQANVSYSSGHGLRAISIVLHETTAGEVIENFVKGKTFWALVAVFIGSILVAIFKNLVARIATATIDGGLAVCERGLSLVHTDRSTRWHRVVEIIKEFIKRLKKS